VRIAVIGAGVAGLTTAKVLKQVGHDVVVYDKAPDVGGVWSETRRYPGVRTQSAKDTYSLSDFPMPKDYPEWPSGSQVQAYLAAYAQRFGVDTLLRLSTEVTSALPRSDGGWTLTLRSTVDGAPGVDSVDHLVVANGIFCDPMVPAYEGLAEFTAAGGRLCSANDFHDAEDARDRHTVVVGYGKSACDIAVPVSDVAATTTVVARQLLWKMPKRLAGVLNFKHLLLTRMGEGLFRYSTLRGFEKFLHGPGNPLRKRLLSSVGTVATRQLRLRKLGLVPVGTFSDIVRNTVSLATDGFFERVVAGRITVHRDRTVSRLLAVDGAPHVELSDGTLVHADLVVCATGFRQAVPFLDAPVRAKLTDVNGNFVLHRQIHPVDVPDLSFAGYNSSFFSPLNAEMAAVWIAALLAGRLELPDRDTMRTQVAQRLVFMDSATNGHHCHGTKIIPFSMHNVDEVLGDLGLDIGSLARARQWLGPIDPGVYRKVTADLAELFPAPQPVVSPQPDELPAAAEPRISGAV
jgi:cation diffusion facilitator CzcD-associated flavoprotein CzcO